MHLLVNLMIKLCRARKDSDPLDIYSTRPPWILNFAERVRTRTPWIFTRTPWIFVERVRTRTPWTFIDAPWGGAPPC